ncbi:2,4-dihydroxyhept-2-ene-1,7-dioic acid aldolase [Thermus scotoductus]|uniref:4-hydroxy-tetrahydrodipicolinate synthase n=1 Tax=Thermus scotoductus TaxID=37636 RepID=A0ABY0AIA0_THESC|nr:2,4-dihydroxyhept-2-ene-1,7-dioic acid aldolase [Thermus scotoductus]RTH19070.1 2,4-dihydroxyhept-2-ene-1,7-dioic acid aldolase [Thermus scotoductus]RTH35050.1 2,4-dihydroxyhept-2-ene-1,7-dioic acid aldolase [Thermus scotoductus]RTI07393.1 2,4-dihydroxyhept-2-ene-1,7-dioic acid aldolase [Thermus scotoductus]RTI15131.1 2,4-dihydroxyhept-2-ene-1,7-dioic acid aldolase [Thermus scotoductus]RTI23334.1 2,4-dihydroxyhept-2-ene-1,7-dioic acid aldolase [Thermus scotoductus]
MFRGSIPPLPTPFRRGRIDEEALRGLVERVIQGGSHGLSVGGTTGEPGTQTLEERKRVIEIALEQAAGRVPVIPGTGALRLEETLELTRFAREAGAQGAMVIVPYYVKPNQEGLYRYFAEVAQAVPDFPILIYNIPGRAGVEIAPRTVARLRRDFPNIVGLKHSSKDLEYLSQLFQEVGQDFLVFCGLESLTLPMMSLGAVGTIAATANWLPKEVAELCQRALDGDFLGARELHFHLLEANEAIFWDTNPIPLKTVLSWMGLLEKEWRLPLGPTTPEVEERLRAMARRYGLLEGEG